MEETDYYLVMPPVDYAPDDEEEGPTWGDVFMFANDESYRIPVLPLSPPPEDMTLESNSATGGKRKTGKARKLRKRNRSRIKRQSDRSTRRTRKYRKRK